MDTLNLCRDVLDEWRDMLDDAGFWPREFVAKMGCAGTCKLVVCLMAHYRPFTPEAFLAALLAYGCTVLGMLVVMGSPKA